jgi:hypothetical protein
MNFAGDALAGTLIDVHVESASSTTLSGSQHARTPAAAAR